MTEQEMVATLKKGRTLNLVVSSAALTPEQIGSAPLPERYTAARGALDRCFQVDECKDWQDQAAALASYAKQANDDELEHFAIRIRGRAQGRLGELLTAQKATVGLNKGAASGGTKSGSRGSYVEPRDSRPTLADAGISRRLSSQAQAIASLPAAVRDAMIEATPPATPAQLAEAARERRNAGLLAATKPPGFVEATQFSGRLRYLAEFCGQTKARIVVGGYEPYEVGRVVENAKIVRKWLDDFLAAAAKRKE